MTTDVQIMTVRTKTKTIIKSIIMSMTGTNGILLAGITYAAHSVLGIPNGQKEWLLLSGIGTSPYKPRPSMPYFMNNFKVSKILFVQKYVPC
jgi:hypothetical protein